MVTPEDENDSVDVAALTAPEQVDTEIVDTVTSDPNAGDEIAITSGDIERVDDDDFEIESLGNNESAGDAEDLIVVHALKAPETLQESSIREAQTEAVSSQGHKFNVFDGAALGDEQDDRDGRDDHDAQAINLHGFVLEDASTIIHEDVPVVDAFADVEQPGLPAGAQLPLIGSEYASKDAAGTSEAGDAEIEDAAALATLGDPVAAAAGEERNESEFVLEDIFDAFDATAFDEGSDDDAVSLDEFVLGEESPRTINDDLPAAEELADVGQSELLASVQLPLIGSEYASKDAPGDLTAAAVADHVQAEQIEAEPALDDIFDAFDDTSLGDDIGDDVANLEEFLLTDDASTNINDDVPAADGLADLEHPGKL